MCSIQNQHASHRAGQLAAGALGQRRADLTAVGGAFVADPNLDQLVIGERIVDLPHHGIARSALTDGHTGLSPCARPRR
jgi:hypothetical protein